MDHGKSTLIGRLLYDSGNVPDDVAAAARKDSERYRPSGDALDFSLLVDGLRAEREQGITIDVAYRYFRTSKREFIIADVPGHEQYTRNMVTGASHCDLALVLVDATEGIIDQTRRHAFLASLLGIRHMVVAVNKMDLVAFDEDRFDAIRRDFADFAARLEVTDIEFIPMSASRGDNVVSATAAMAWYRGRPLLDYLENVHVASDVNLIDLRLPVQTVIRSGGERHVAGTIASGVMRAGDEVIVLPARQTARVAALTSAGEAATETFAPMAVTVVLDGDVDVSRGDVLAHVRNIPSMEREFDAMLAWLDAEPLHRNREYLLKHPTAEVGCAVTDIRYRIDVHELRHHDADVLAANEIGRVKIVTGRPIAREAYARNRTMGSLILIDRLTGATAAAGMILDREAMEAPSPAKSLVTAADRLRRFGHSAFVIHTPPAVALDLERLLFDRGCLAVITARGEDVSLLLRAGAIVIVADESAGTVRIADSAIQVNDAPVVVAAMIERGLLDA